MSVDFFALQDNETLLSQPASVACRCENVQPLRFATRREAQEWADARAHQPVGERMPLPGCTDEYCLAEYLYARTDSALDALAVNMSNANARAVLVALGLYADGEDDLAGSIDAEDLLGRVLLAQAIMPADAGVPAVRTGSLYDCGRPEGYIEERLVQIADLAQACREQHLAAAWS